MLQDQVGGFYDPTTKTFYLMDNCPQSLAKIVLSHELGHALDDQLYDIDGTLKKLGEHSDMALAYQAVVEGSGTTLMTRWTKDHVKLTDLFGFSKMQDEQTASMARSPMILWKPLLAAYMKGAAFLSRTESVFEGQTTFASHEDLERAFRDPPKSTEQILHPAKYWESGKRDDPVPVSQAATDALKLPSEWSVLRRDVMGEMALGVWTIPPAKRGNVDTKDITNVLGMQFTNSAAEGWGGDEVLLLGTSSGARALRWLTVWDTPRDAAEFYGAASMVVPELEASLVQLAGGKKQLATAEIRYGSEREVVIELGFGMKRAESKTVFGAFEKH